MSEWLLKLDKTKGICPNCKTFVGKNKLEIDHIIPISKAPRGFIYTINDIQPLCRSCNASKGNKLGIIK
jgi:5-methylcytosine-specific restriction endonuclease McrA